MINSIGNVNVFHSLKMNNFKALHCKPQSFDLAQNVTAISADKLASAYQVLNGISFKGIQKPTNVMISDRVDINQYKEVGRQAVEDVTSRAGIKGQFLNWIDKLPSEQLRKIDAIYDKAAKAHAAGKTDIAVIGIGGSRHTTESLVKMLNREQHAHFYSSVDPDSFKRFTKELPMDKTVFLIVSKSGKTLETTTGYENTEKAVKKHLHKRNVKDSFYAVTDASPSVSLLRQQVVKGRLQDAGVVHDDVGGRYSTFDDATLFTLAYLGLPKADAIKMLKSSLKAQKEFKNPDINQNDALKLAASNVDSKTNDRSRHFVEYFGDAFSAATLWEKQLKNESLKSRIATDTNVGPGYLHYNAEADLDEGNTDSAFTFVYTKSKDKLTNAVIKGVTTAYKKQHPVNEIVMDKLSPEAIGRFIELKHFETLYTGNMLRRLNGDVTDQQHALPEVLQDNVEKYKQEVRNAMQN